MPLLPIIKKIQKSKFLIHYWLIIGHYMGQKQKQEKTEILNL